MTSLAELLHRLAPEVVTPLLPLTDEERVTQLHEVVLYDGDSTAVGPGDVVFAVGLRPGPDAGAVIRELARRRPAAVVLRAALAAESVVRSSVAETGIFAFVVDDAASWLQLTLLVREVLEDDPASHRPGSAADDLFRVANSIAALVGGPVTVEDVHSRVLAFSDDQEGADDARLATILGRRAPSSQFGRMKERGVFRRLHGASAPVFVPGLAPDIKARMAMPVRAGGEFLGSIWVVVEDRPTQVQEAAIASCAPTVAMHLLRGRVTAATWRSSELAALTSLLDGGATASEAARRLRLTAASFHVVALSHRAGGGLDAEAHLLRMWDGLGMSLSATFRGSLLGKVGDRIYGVVPLGAAAGIAALTDYLRRFIAEHAPRHDIVAGVGGAVGSVTGLPTSRAQADDVVDVLSRDPAGPPVTDIEAIGSRVLLARVLRAMADDPEVGTGALRRLIEHDLAKGTSFQETVVVYLEVFGNTEAAAERLAVHPNTVRYRIRALRELDLVDLADPTERLALLLHAERLRSSGDTA